MTRIAAIFYYSHKDGLGRVPVSLGPVKFPPQVGYVRTELVHGAGLQKALDLAKPRRDENVMNALWVQVEQFQEEICRKPSGASTSKPGRKSRTPSRRSGSAARSKANRR